MPGNVTLRFESLYHVPTKRVNQLAYVRIKRNVRLAVGT
jgi:hypothetical protein